MIKLPDLKNINLKDLDLKDPKTQRIVLIALVTFLVFAGYIYFMFFPQVRKVTGLSRQIFNTKKEIAAAKETVAMKDALVRKLKQYNEKVESYEQRLPAEQEIPSLLGNLSKMAKDANIKIVGITPAMAYFKNQNDDKSQIYQEIPILITAKSGYHELGYFLSNMESSDRFMKVVDIDIKANKTTPRIHDVELMVITYILLPER